MDLNMTPEREQEIRELTKDSSFISSEAAQELLAEIDALRAEKRYELEAMNTIGHERIVVLEKERDQLKNKLIDVEEQICCADINLDNLAIAISVLKIHPFFKVVKFQLSEAISKIRGEK
jgi:hypothetical protein